MITYLYYYILYFQYYKTYRTIFFILRRCQVCKPDAFSKILFMNRFKNSTKAFAFYHVSNRKKKVIYIIFHFFGTSCLLYVYDINTGAHKDKVLSVCKLFIYFSTRHKRVITFF